MTRKKWIVPIAIALGFLTYLSPSLTNKAESIELGIKAKLGSSLIQTIEGSSSGEFPILVFLKAKADLSGLEEIENRNTRLTETYDRLRTVALNSQTDLVRTLQNKSVKFQRFYISNMIAVDGAPIDLIRELASRKDVARITNNPTIQNDLGIVQEYDLSPFSLLSLIGEDQEGAGIEGNIIASGASKVWGNFQVKGEGIVVAGQDTGVQWDHPALQSQYRGNIGKGEVDHTHSWHDAIHEGIGSSSNPCGYNSSVPCDDNKHGTHTIGTIVGDDGGNNKIGVAPKSQWMACRNMDLGTGRPTTYIECFEYFLAPYAQGSNPMTDGNPTKAPHVINNSWGCPKSEGCEGDEMKDIMEVFEKAGIMMVVSAGNEGSGCSTIADQPASISPTTLSVGAHNHRNNTIAGFSSRGPSKLDGGVGPDVTAPGVSIRSSIPGSSYDGSFWSGTSMAGPHVAGQVALIWGAQPKLIGKIQQTVQLIRETATPTTTSQACGGVTGDKVPNNTYGFGRIDIFKSVEKALSL